MKPKQLATSDFQTFVQQIAAVPKDEADKIEAERPKRTKPKRKPVKAK